MAVKGKHSKPVKTVIILTSPKNPLDCIEGQVGGTTLWEFGKSSYPDFYLYFRESNPFNARKSAIFKGSLDKPLTLVYKTAGTFQFDFVHIKKDGSKIERGPFCIVVRRPPDQFLKPPHGCPPFC